MDAQNWEIVLDVLVERIVKLEDDLIKSKAMLKASEQLNLEQAREISKMLMEDK